MQLADTLITDSKSQTVERGEFQHALTSGLVPLAGVCEIGEVVGGDAASRALCRGENDNRLTVFDTSGVAVEDIQIAKMVYLALKAAEEDAKSKGKARL